MQGRTLVAGLHAQRRDVRVMKGRALECAHDRPVRSMQGRALQGRAMRSGALDLGQLDKGQPVHLSLDLGQSDFIRPARENLTEIFGGFGPKIGVQTF